MKPKKNKKSRRMKSIDDLQQRFAPLKASIPSTHSPEADQTSSPKSKTFSIADVTADQFAQALRSVAGYAISKKAKYIKDNITGSVSVKRVATPTEARRARSQADLALVRAIERCALAYIQVGETTRTHRNPANEIASAIKSSRQPCADCGRVIRDNWTRWDVFTSHADAMTARTTSHSPLPNDRVCYRCSRRYAHRMYMGKRQDECSSWSF